MLRTHVADLQTELASAQAAAAAGAGAAAELEDAQHQLAALQQVCFEHCSSTIVLSEF